MIGNPSRVYENSAGGMEFDTHKYCTGEASKSGGGKSASERIKREFPFSEVIFHFGIFVCKSNLSIEIKNILITFSRFQFKTRSHGKQYYV